MIRHLLFKEFLDHIRTLKFRLVTIVCFLTLIISNLTLYHRYRLDVDDVAQSIPQGGEVRVMEKPSILALYGTGLNQLMRQGFDIQPGTMIVQPSSSVLDVDFVSGRFPVPDAAYLVRTLFSFLAIILTFDAVSGEKANGTLRLLLSYGIRRTDIILGKICSQCLALLVPLAGGLVSGLFFMVAFGSVEIGRGEATGIGAFFLVSALYLVFFILLGTAVSARTHSPGTSLIVSLFLWAVLVFGIPNLIGTVSQLLCPVPAVQGLEERKLLADAFTPAAADPRNEQNRHLGSTAVLSEMEQTYRNTLNRHVDLARTMALLSPASAYTSLTATIAQSGFGDHRRMKDMTISFRDGLLHRSQVFANQIIIPPRPLGERFADVGQEVAVLFCCTLLAFGGVVTGFQRYDAR